ncbi:hypothetical protein RRG08_065153 [Elysia crispata]|uniref:Thiopurine S-methyltransferase n=1 Tax=Elysia crispata TaxID=231223 RepID=A0AAE1AHY6_9GAST|nr:hypothetical protein RRG08_065153 [Elysia crispata]
MDQSSNTDLDAVYWDDAYDTGKTRWHRQQVHSVLMKHFAKLNPDDKAKNVLVTMCGMTVDMNWLADKGLQVVGVDIALQALTKYMSNSGQNWTEQPAPKFGNTAKVFTASHSQDSLVMSRMVLLECPRPCDSHALVSCSMRSV